MSTFLEFQPLGDELARAVVTPRRVGAHDFSRFTVSGESAAHPVVALHEAMHDRALTETPFGQVQWLLHRVKCDCEDGHVRAAAVEWFRTLLAASRLTHERWATYLSIKLLPAAMQAAALGSHPAKYRRYYSDLADLVDPHFHSTFLQFIVAMTALEVCLSPPLPLRMSAWAPEWPATLEDDERPDWRFGVVRRVLGGDTLSHLLHRVSMWTASAPRRLGLRKGFDPQREDHWWGEPSSALVEIADVELQNTVRGWMFVECSEAMPSIFPHRAHLAWRPMADRLAGLSGLALGDDLRRWPASLDAEGDESAVRRAVRAGSSSILNPEAIFEDPVLAPLIQKVGLARVGTARALSERLAESDGLRIVASKDWSSVPTKHPDWLVVTSRDGVTEVAAVPHSVVGEALRPDQARPSRRLPETVRVVVGLAGRAPGMMEAVGDASLSGPASALGGPSQAIVWCMGGDLFDWVTWLVREGGEVEATSFRLPEVDRRQSPGAGGADEASGLADGMREVFGSGLWCYALTSSRHAGLFIRWVASGASIFIAGAMAQLMKAGAVMPMDEARRRQSAGVAVEVLDAIRVVWPEY